MGFQVKLDTNGSNPRMIENILSEGLIDYIAMDIKHTWDQYDIITGAHIDTSLYKESIRLIQELAPDYEFRTTVIR